MKKFIYATRRAKKQMGAVLGGWLQLLSLILIGSVLVLFATRQTAQTASPTISTDKSDYQPGDIVIMTGSGWIPGQPVALHIDETDGEMWDSSAIADELGNISNSEFVVAAHDVGVAFSLTASQGDVWAWTQFT